MKRLLASLAIMMFFASIAFTQTLPDEVIVSYTCANKPLTTVLDELSNRSGVNIVYSAKRLPKRSNVTIQGNNEELGVLLSVILSDFGYRYKIVGNQLVVVRDDLEEVEEMITINGYVQDSVSGERLVYSNIYLLGNTQGTESNEYGYFSFTLPKGDQRVYFSYLGYKQRVADFRLRKDSSVVINMVPDVQLNEIVILDADEVEADQNTSSESRMNYDELQSMTSLGGEADVVRLANILPGVASGADGFGGLNVRGGSSDQNLVLFDGVPVYNAGHALGIFSIFNSNVIKSATLIKGGFPARYGGRLSSVLDIRTREGSTKKHQGAVSISAIAMKTSVEGPIGEFNSYDYDRFEQGSDTLQTQLNYKASSYLSKISDKGAKLDLDYIYSPSHYFKFGVGAIQHNYDPGIISINEKTNPIELSQPVLKSEVEALIESPSIVGNEVYGYLEDQMSFGYGFMLNLGLHTSYITTEEKSYLNWQPRIALMIRGDAVYFKASASKMNQYLHLITNNGLGLPAEIWLPSTDRIQPQTSWVYSSTMACHSKDTGFHFGGEVFYKSFDNLSAFNEGPPINISQGNNWENRIPLGRGEAYGVELFLDKVAGRTTWMANYTYTKSKRQFNQLNNGEEFLHRFSLDHNLKLSFRHRLTADAEFSLNYHISSGSRVTTPSGDVVIGPNGEIIIEYDERNNEILPSYQRLDIGFNFYNKYDWGRQKISIGAYNVLDKRNPFYVDIQRDRSFSNRFELVSYNILPIFPAISYSLSF